MQQKLFQSRSPQSLLLALIILSSGLISYFGSLHELEAHLGSSLFTHSHHSHHHHHHQHLGQEDRKKDHPHPELADHNDRGWYPGGGTMEDHFHLAPSQSYNLREKTHSCATSFGERGNAAGVWDGSTTSLYSKRNNHTYRLSQLEFHMLQSQLPPPYRTLPG